MVLLSPVINPNAQQPPTFPSIEAERRHRQERLAAAFRVFARYGLVQGLAGHISARDPELTDHFWINPLGVHFSRIRVSDLLLVNPHGEVVKGDRSVGKADECDSLSTPRSSPGYSFSGSYPFLLWQDLVNPGTVARPNNPGCQCVLPRSRSVG